MTNLQPYIISYVHISNGSHAYTQLGLEAAKHQEVDHIKKQKNEQCQVTV